MKKTETFDEAYANLKKAMIDGTAEQVNVGEWQAIRDEKSPMSQTWELQDITIQVDLKLDPYDWQQEIKPNMPWAEDHFRERVGGLPLNPPPSNRWWPFAQRGNEQHKADELFSHTYPERIWPKTAGDRDYRKFDFHRGIRYPYGDLLDVLHMLGTSPGTRQAYLPIWFPEDTGAISNQRVPCTLGYHFMIRNGSLRIAYYMRSCDLLRHFPDDVYMAGRLAQWMRAELANQFAKDVDLSYLIMHIGSLHIFDGDIPRLKAETSG